MSTRNRDAMFIYEAGVVNGRVVQRYENLKGATGSNAKRA